MDKTVPVHSAQKVGNVQEPEALHSPGWQHSSKAPHCETQPAAPSSQLALACNPDAPAIATGQPEGGPSYDRYKGIAQRLLPAHSDHWPWQ